MEIFKGCRGDKFKYFILQVLKLSTLKKEYYPLLLDREGMVMYERAFTHKTANKVHNYEYLEFLGDTTLNKGIAWYLSRRFTQLNCPEGVKVLTRLKINLISKRSFARFAKRLGFWNFISADMDVRNTKMDKTLEDVFESFFGVTELLLDQKIAVGVGYQICYSMIKTLLDRDHISLQYTDLFDAKTRLKEVFDQYRDSIGTLKYNTEKVDRIHNVTAVCVNSSQSRSTPFVLGTGSAPLKADASQRAAEQAIATLKELGFTRTLPDDYKLFCDGCD